MDSYIQNGMIDAGSIVESNCELNDHDLLQLFFKT
jgi:hypothetical protein